MDYAYDLIGDIHGYATTLTKLLELLGYEKKGQGFAHPVRKAIFLGDYIDRGPEIPRTLEIVKSMVDSGSAIALMGNHEYNTLCFHEEKKSGGHLRKHSIKNILQHDETLRQFRNEQKAYEKYLEWFLTLPLYLEEEKFRAVHACWNAGSIATLKEKLSHRRLDKHLLKESTDRDSKLYDAVDITLKGQETQLPEGIFFSDKDGHHRTKIRTKWWEDPASQTYRTLSVEALPNLPDIPVIDQTSHGYYGEHERPVFFGHYWLKGVPAIYRDNVCCLDYSVAKDGYLTAYRFDGEPALRQEKIVYC